MSNIVALRKKIKSGNFNDVLSKLYGNDEQTLKYQINRYIAAIDSFNRLYSEIDEISLFSAGGRTEICGNHTDHNLGKTLSAAVDLDIIAVAAKHSQKLEVTSEGFLPDKLSVCDIEYVKVEENTSKALIKGVCKGLFDRGYNYGGALMYTTSNVLKGSGVSSSAAFEVLISTVQNYFYNDGKISPAQIAQISQFSENKYFGKPSGLLDQMSSSVGGFIVIDFEDKINPFIEKIDVNFSAFNHTLCIIDTGGNHADLTCEYAAIPSEMKAVAAFFEKEFVREISKQDILDNLPQIRNKLGDRAPLRALHFLDENERVQMEANALKSGDFDRFLGLVKESGASSYMYLQNIYSSQNIKEQGLSLALYLCSSILKDRGAYRVHGGGFGGTVQAFVPNDMLSDFKNEIEKVFSKGSVKILKIRSFGGVMLE